MSSLLQAIIRFCLDFRALVVLAVAGFVLFAAARLPDAAYDVFPEFAPPSVQLQTEAPGFDPRQVEALVTDRLEHGLAGLPGLVAMRSQSQAGLSVVDLVFAGGTGIYRARQLVAERLAGVIPSLPAGASAAIAPLQSATGTVLDIGLTAPGQSLMQLTGIVRRTVRPALLAVPGVANVVIFGAVPAQLQVQAEPRLLAASGFGLGALANAARHAIAQLGGGFIDTGNQDILLQGHGQATDAAALATGLVGMRGAVPVRIGDVARVVQAPPPAIGAALIHGQPGLLLIVSSLRGANMLAVTHAVAARLATLRPALRQAGVKVDPQALRPADFITTALGNLALALGIGAGLILAVLFLALRDWRAALIAFISIPVSLLAAITLLQALGISLNIMSLGGLAIALGEVVDDAVVDIENIHRRLRENRAAANPAPALGVILAASTEVRGAIIFATLSVALAFVPVLFLGGVAGRLFAPLAMAYIAAILASLLVALTLTPALAGLLLAPAAGKGREGTPIFARTRRAYGRLLDGLGRVRGVYALVLGALVLGAAASVPLLATSFLPRFDERDVIVHYLAAPGTALRPMLAIGRRLSARLAALPEVADVVLHVGRAQQSNGHAGTNKAEIDITLRGGGAISGAAAPALILRHLGQLPGFSFWANSFLTERIHETLSGFAAPLVVTIHGPSLGPLGMDAARVVAIMRRIPGVVSASIAAPPNLPAITITPRRGALARAGLTEAALMRVVGAAYAGELVGDVGRRGLLVPIMLTLPPQLRADPSGLADLPVRQANGALVPLGQLARLAKGATPAVILHSGGSRVQVVTVQTRAGSGDAVLARARRLLGGLTLAPGDYLAFGGAAVAGAGARDTLAGHAGLALLGILLLLGIALRRVRAAILLLAGLPVAMAGGVAALWLSGGVVSLGAAVGFVSLSGIALRNGLLLLIHARRQAEATGQGWSDALLRQAAVARLPAILITAMLTALALLPLALGSGRAGEEIEGPMALVILGGLCGATILTLTLLPLLGGWIMGGRRER